MNILSPTARLRRCISLFFISVAVSTFGVSAVSAAEPTFPTKLVRIICAFPPGNSSDVVARIISERLATRWGQSVIVENRPGASGTIAAQAVMRSPADGYTLLMTSTSFVINKSVLKNVPYDLEKDFSAVSLINSIPVALLVRPDFPATNMKEWVAEVQANPGKYASAHPGVGTMHNLTTKLLEQQTKTELLEVPYNGSTQALSDIMAGTTDMMFEAANSAFNFVNSGRLRAIAVSGPSRYYALPDVPTLAEQGIDVETLGFTALLAPAGTPKDIAGFINSELQAVLKDPKVQETMKTAALDVYQPMDAVAAQDWLISESKKWAQIASAAHIKQE